MYYEHDMFTQEAQKTQDSSPLVPGVSIHEWGSRQWRGGESAGDLPRCKTPLLHQRDLQKHTTWPRKTPCSCQINETHKLHQMSCIHFPLPCSLIADLSPVLTQYVKHSSLNNKARDDAKGVIISAVILSLTEIHKLSKNRRITTSRTTPSSHTHFHTFPAYEGMCAREWLTTLACEAMSGNGGVLPILIISIA